MPATITDYTKNRLSKLFQAKGVSGSSLIEDLQPTVQVHDLERGPFNPTQRFSWIAQVTAVAAQQGMIAIGPALTIAEQTIIIDRVSVYSSVAQSFLIGVTNSPGFNTTQATLAVLGHDQRSNSTFRLDQEFTLGQGTVLGVPIVPGFLHDGIFTANQQATVELGVVFDRKGYLLASVPQLFVVGSVVNIDFRVQVSGRLFPCAA